MNSFFLGKPSQKIVDWTEQHYSSTETVGGKWTLYDSSNQEIQTFDQYSEPNPIRHWQNESVASYAVVFGSSRYFPIPHWELYYEDYSISETEKQYDSKAKTLNVVKTGSSDSFTLKWTQN